MAVGSDVVGAVAPDEVDDTEADDTGVDDTEVDDTEVNDTLAVVASRWFPGEQWVTRARSAGFFTGLVVIPAVLVAGTALWTRGPSTPAIVATAALAAVLGWTFFWRPVLRVREQGLTVVNPWRTHEVPWTALIDVQTKFTLTLVTADARIPVDAAPAPGGRTALRAKPDPTGPSGRSGRSGRTDSSAAHDPARWGNRPSDLASTDSGVAARIVRGHWQDIVEGHRAPPTQEVEAGSTVHLGTALIAALLAGVAVAAWLYG